MWIWREWKRLWDKGNKWENARHDFAHFFNVLCATGHSSQHDCTNPFFRPPRAHTPHCRIVLGLCPERLALAFSSYTFAFRIGPPFIPTITAPSQIHRLPHSFAHTYSSFLLLRFSYGGHGIFWGGSPDKNTEPPNGVCGSGIFWEKICSQKGILVLTEGGLTTISLRISIF